MRCEDDGEEDKDDTNTPPARLQTGAVLAPPASGVGDSGNFSEA